MIEGHTHKHLVERRLIESRNSEVIKTHSESIRFNRRSNQRQSEEIAVRASPFGMVARQRRARTIWWGN
jgi:hypothetical protein